MVDAPRVVSSLASPTRPEWAVTRRSMPAAAAVKNRSPIICAESGTTRSPGLWTRGGPQRPDGARDAVLHEPHVVHLALLVRLAPADGDENAVAVGRIDDIQASSRRSALA